MRFTDLIIEAALEAFEAGAELGVRLSPLKITPAEVMTLVETTRGAHQRGYVLHLAVASSDVKEIDEPRCCVAPGERAPERATEWRNSISSQGQQRVIYIAPSRLGKAGGLEDTLLPINEESLRATCYQWMSAEGLGQRLIPIEFTKALKSSALSKVISARALMIFIERLSDLTDGTQATWAQIGDHLTCLSLLRDSELSPNDALQRLNANLSVVEGALKNELRGSATTTTVKDLSARLSAHLKSYGDRGEALNNLDLGEAETRALTPTSRKANRAEKVQRAIKQTRERLSKGQKATKKKTTTETTEERLHEAFNQSDELTSVEHLNTLQSLDERVVNQRVAQNDDVKGAGEALKAQPNISKEEVLDEPSYASPPPLNSPLWELRSTQGKLRAVKEMTPALRDLCSRVSAKELPWGITLTVKPPHLRRCLTKLPAIQRETPHAKPTLSEGLQRDFALWDERREALTEALYNAGGAPLSAELSGAALSMMIDDELLSQALKGLLVASSEALKAVTQLGDPSMMLSALQRDTLTIVSQASGERLMILGPLHPLILGQTLARLHQYKAAKGSSQLIKSLLVKSLTEAPIAPQVWRDEEGDLTLTPPELGVVVYESSPNLLLDEDLSALTQALTLKYLDLHPYATLGLVALLEGTPRGAALDGVAEAIDAHKDRGVAPLRSVEVIVNDHVRGALKEKTLNAISEGTLRLTPRLAAHQQRPHLIISIVDGLNQCELSALFEGEDSPQLSQRLSISQRGEQTIFKVEPRGLHTLSPVRGVLGCEETEALLSALEGRSPRGYLINTERALKLGSLFPSHHHAKTAWQVAISAKLSKVPRADAHLLLHERVGTSAEVAVMSKSTRATTRSLTPTLKRLGAMDQRAKVLERFAERLASLGGQGVTSLVRSPDQLIAAAALSLHYKAARQEAPGVFGLIEGASLSRLLGYKAQGFPGAISLSFWWARGALHFLISYAAINERLSGDLRATKPDGELIDIILRLYEVIRLSTAEGVELKHTTSREALKWLLMPALAERVLSGEVTLSVLQSKLDRLGEEFIKVEVSSICLLSELTDTRELTLRGGLKLTLAPLGMSTLDELMSAGGAY